ncbi:MAG: T9SS type A sorting domain-containing protein [Chitinivibrionales bacterium]|nr:T9SS type A sorting domain-containing protein [Chitinivibrionales bacterium]MBD3356183.1 T9SS type A sorting domain-containing protein [Chitinivibrionales bacterium]
MMTTFRLVFLGLFATASADVSIRDPLFRDGATSDYLIIAPDSTGILQHMGRLAERKRQKGLRAHIVTVDSILAHVEGFDPPHKIRNFLKTAHKDRGVTWVLLAGDFRLIPARRVSTGAYFPSDSTQFLSDAYYSCLEGDWDPRTEGVYGDEESGIAYKLECRFDEDGDFVCDRAVSEVVGIDLRSDIYIGRMPVSNAEEARVMVDKTIQYTAEPRPDGRAGGLFFFGPKVHYRITKNYATGNKITDAAQYWHYEMLPLFRNPTSLFRTATIDERYEDRLTPAGEITGDSIEITPDELDTCLSRGYNLVFFSCHGSPNHILISSRTNTVYSRRDVLNLKSNHYSNIASISCDVMKMPPESTMCLAKSFLVNPDGGAVSYNGSSAEDYMISKREHYLGAARYLSTGATAHIAKAFQVANLELDRYNQFVHQYWGDPELTIRTREITANDTFAIDIAKAGDSYRIQLLPAVDSALVCLYKKHTAFERGYTRNGLVMLDTVPPAVKTMRLTATKHNYLPTSLSLDASDITTTGIRRTPIPAASAPFTTAVEDRRIMAFFSPGDSILRATLYTASGQTLKRFHAGAPRRKWSTRRMPAGVYLLSVTIADNRIIKRVIVR